jgi:hypothetical protein
MRLAAVLASAALVLGLQGCWRNPARPSANLPPPVPQNSQASSVSAEVAFDLAEVASALRKSVPRTLDSSTEKVNVPANILLTAPTQMAAEAAKYVTKAVPETLADTCKKGGVSGWLVFPCQVIKQAEAVGNAVGPAVDKAVRAVDEAPNLRSPVDVEITRNVFLDDVDLSTSGNLLRADATLSFDLKVVKGGTASCGIGEPRPQVKLGEPMQMHWGADGKLLIEKEQWTLTWIRPCNLTFAGIDIQDVLKISGLERTIDRKIDEAVSRIPKEVDVTSAFDRVWASAMEPREIVKDLWLSVRPAGAIVSEPFGQGRTLSFTVTLVANPLLSYGDKPKVTANVRPPFEHTATPADFSVELDSEASFREIEKILNAQFAGKDEVVAGRKLRIADIEAHASGTSVVLGVGIAEPFRGRLYLSGKPAFDRASGTVRLEDLDYTVETRNMLAKAREWILHSKTREALRAESVFPLSRYMPEAMAKLSRYDDTVQGVKFSLRVPDPSITQLFVAQDGVHVRLQLKGTAKAHLVSATGD